ncbi:thioredoxin family protein [Robinsoniella peoriensis]|uniref:thioredoxin family protein n=1 Tax=Robinsoniella peoriensis TaxID=180332 RepID=UPI00085C5D2E|nr:thioredoxin family protein [Robinsoniella peoriensis]
MKNIVTKIVSALFILSMGINILLLILFNHNNTVISTNPLSRTYDYINSITIRNFEKNVESGKEMYIYIGRSDCEDCINFEPIFHRIVEEYNLEDKIVYLNVQNYRKNSTEIEWESFKNMYGFSQTPAIIHFKEKKNISYIEWDERNGMPEDLLKTWLEENGIM